MRVFLRGQIEVVLSRWAALESERRRMDDEFAQKGSALAEQRAKVERDRADLARLQSEAARAAEEMARRLREREIALDRTREELRKEAASFDDKVRQSPPPQASRPYKKAS
jgi:septal ring factor EnvC (AmiA/AmiB activator)